MAWRAQLSKNLKELRIIFCQTSPASSQTRAFVEGNYKDLKTLNPKFPILIRECRGVEPQLWARYGMPINSLNFFATALLTELLPGFYMDLYQDMGVERGVHLEGMTEAQILKAVEDLVTAGAARKA